MTRRRIRSITFAALTLVGVVVPIATASPPASAVAVLAGLDCGIAGTITAPTSTYFYDVHGVALAGPYEMPGTNARLSCVLRRGSTSGAAVTSWSVSGAGGSVPAQQQVLDFSYFSTTPIGELFLCSYATWQTINGTESASGCELAWLGWLNPTDADFQITIMGKPQDPDLDSFPS